MRSIAVTAFTVVGATLAAAAPAGAQAPAPACEAPVVEAFHVPPAKVRSYEEPSVNRFRAGVDASLIVVARGAASIELDWGDGEREIATVREGGARFRHAYRRPGRRAVVATAVAACGARAAGARITLDVPPPCRVSMGAELFGQECDRERRRLRLTSGGLTARGAWRPLEECRPIDVPFTEVKPERPAARASESFPSCQFALVRPAGRLPVPAGRRLRLLLQTPATRVSFRFLRGGRPAGPRRPARRHGATGLQWFVPSSPGLAAADGISVRADRDGKADAWVASLRATR
ncbi:MAG: hypothetical protein AVDCRST_MAG30-1952 [uncultured Solirubrobacteraceae bacterium]|uniref:C-type lysozyme inhibitor domain-containing protein n=1 Tax=uncultured Solirubrobacteraceae bacterium TaxID=1162706 RepID=A0A6J4SPZ8_9ACTN|nr:MAG: hypothetical protein AVDCRST_MAG30-1952 [uncultured Solirubrobacteraceae bacterium]